MSEAGRAAALDAGVLDGRFTVRKAGDQIMLNSSDKPHTTAAPHEPAAKGAGGRTGPAASASGPRGPSLSREAAVIQDLTWVVDAWKHAIENKDWVGLAELIGLREIYITGHPEESGEVARRVTELTRDLCDFEVVLGDVLKQQITDDHARFTFSVKVLWSAVKDWTDHELDVLVHVGFTMRRDGWTATHLVLDRATPAQAPPSPRAAAHAAPPATDAAAGATASPPRAQDPPRGDDGAAPGDRPLSDDRIADAAALYFARRGDAEAGSPPPSSSSSSSSSSAARGKKHLIYVPVLMDADLIRDLLA